MAARRRPQGVVIQPTPPSAVQLLRDIRSRRLDPLDMQASDRRLCIAILMTGAHTAHELSELFKVSTKTVRADMRKVRQEVGTEAVSWTTEEVLGGLVMNAEKLTAMALRQEDAGLAWTIQRDLAKLMREYGLGPRTSGVKITLESLGGSYEHASMVLARSLDPLVTGEVIPIPLQPDLEPRGLPAPQGLPDDEPQPEVMQLPDAPQEPLE